jgi:hypothetical protein
MRKKNLPFKFLCLLIFLNSCVKDEPFEIITTDISVSTLTDKVIYNDTSDLETKLDQVVSFDFGNALENELNILREYNDDYTRVIISINFKNEFTNKYNDLNPSNNIIVIDLEESTNISFEGNDPITDFNLGSDPWITCNITFSFFNHTSDLSVQEQEEAFLEAGRIWTDQIPGMEFINLGQNNNNAILRIDFTNDINHPPCPKNFTSSSTIAHAFWPIDPNWSVDYAGDIHFNDNFIYTNGSSNITLIDFISIAVHEIGHSLGIAHNPQLPNSVMYPSYSTGSVKRNLSQDDINAINAQYFNNCSGNAFSNISLSNDIDFGNVQVNTTSTTQTLIVSNTGNLSFDITNISSSNNAFEIINGQSTTVEPNSNISFDIQFSPSNEQTYNGVITVDNTADNANSSNSSIQVTGTGTNNSTSDLVVEEIWLDDDGNGQYDINTRIRNVGSEATPANEDIIVKYYIDDQLVGDDTENPLDPDEDGTEALNNYQFSYSGTYEFKVEIEPVSNEGNTSNNSLVKSFQISVGNNNTSDLVVEEIWLDDDGNGQYDINTRIRNTGSEATPANEDIIVKYYINDQLVGDDTENPLDPNEDGTEALNNYQFSNSGTYEFKVEIEPVSNEGNTSNNSLVKTFQISVGNNGSSDLIVEEIWLDDDGNGQYDINTRIRNIGSEATPANEDIIVKYYINDQLVGDDTENPLDPNEDGTEALNNYQFSNSGTYEFKVEIEPVSNEGNTSNNSLVKTFQISVGSNNSIVPTDLCDDSPILLLNTEYEINVDISDYGLATPIDGQSDGGNNVRGFWLSFQVPSGQTVNNINIYDTSNNFDPVIGVKTNCSHSNYLPDISTNNFYNYANHNGTGLGELFQNNFIGQSTGNDGIYHIRVYHYYGNETPNISFKIKVD